MKKISLLVVLCLTATLSFCQDYVVNIQGDTLRGPVKILSMDPIDQVQVIFNGKKINLTAVKARAVFFDHELYHSVRNAQTQKFMKVIKSGFLSLYAFKLPNQTGYDGLFLTKKNGQTIEVPNLGFKKILAGFLEECARVADAIRDESLRRADLYQIVDRFNSCNSPVSATATTAVSTSIPEKLAALDNFQKQVDGMEAFAPKKDVTDILHDIKEKLERQEAVPSYLYGVLKTHFASQTAMTTELDKLIAVLGK